ncbi:L-2-hydroxyglutarate oxidase [Microlunatus parietis]|uniref:L-2-hydroxyglutarate oxidase LhgO n=1 Tax=Microlunatus parietis TaxID=682979 RepID=A0A7Y9ID46_9ACTN|nr:L-2-hydroxyglutarate oxidase [Microlunatus parietis]NYE74497.1 L-2-hydroxyglutarate oxidase LhgO [Microlunatus parietis]
MVGKRVAVIGAGIIGAAVARELLLRDPATRVTVIEKEAEPALHQTGRNSGVVHAGLYYLPGSAKARLVRSGIALLRAFCDDHGLPYQEVGKVLVALTDQDRERMAAIFERARANGVPGVRLVDADGLRELEPHAAGIAGLHSPSTAITDYGAITRALLGDVTDAGGELRTGVAVTAFTEAGDEVRVFGGEELGGYHRVINCAGLQADRLARLAGDQEYPVIVPFRGEFAALRADRAGLVNGLIYPVPDPRYPFLGVHLTRRVDGRVLVGPNAVLALAREGYRRRDVAGDQLLALLRWAGFRRFARRNWATGIRELAGSSSRRLFARAARRYLPELRVRDLEPAPPGIRAQAMDADGSLVDDFRISRAGRVVCVRNAPSPAATASLAIAREIVDVALG